MSYKEQGASVGRICVSAIDVDTEAWGWYSVTEDDKKRLSHVAAIVAIDANLLSGRQQTHLRMTGPYGEQVVSVLAAWLR